MRLHRHTHTHDVGTEYTVTGARIGKRALNGRRTKTGIWGGGGG